MADKKLSEMTDRLNTIALDNDYFLVHDISASASKAIEPNWTGSRSRFALVGIDADKTTQDLTGDFRMDWENGVDTEDFPGIHNKIWLGNNGNLTVTANATSDELTFPSPHDLKTGDGPFQLTTSGTLPAGLATGTNYWAIRQNTTVIQVASSLANAVADTAIDITDTGTGTHTTDTLERLIVPYEPDGIAWTHARATFGFNLLLTSANLFSFAYIYAVLSGAAETLNYPGSAIRVMDVTITNHNQQVATAIIPVVAGDFFSFRPQIQTDTSVTIDANRTWAQLELFRGAIP